MTQQDDGYLTGYNAGYRIGFNEANRYRLTLEPVALFLAGMLAGVSAIAAAAFVIGLVRA